MKFVKLLKQLRLTAEEKEKSRGFLIARMGLDPVRNPGVGRHSFWKVPFFPAFLTNKYMIATLIAAILIAFGGGTAAAAENSLPGDLLYPVKLKINEEVKSALSLSAEAKSSWDARRAERRLEEAEKLAVAGEVSSSTSKALAERFRKYSEKMEDRLDRLEESGALSPEQVAELKANFEASLKAHAGVIAQMQAREQARLQTVWDSLRDRASSTIRWRLEKEARLFSEDDSDDSATSTMREAAEGRRNSVVSKIAEVDKFIKNNDDKVSVEVKNEAVAKLNEARAKLAEGDEDFADGKFREAFVKFSEAHRIAQEAKMYFTARFRLRFVLAGDSVSSTLSLTVSSTDDGNDATVELEKDIEEVLRERRSELKDNLKDLEEKLREELKTAQERAREVRKDELEKAREDDKKMQELLLKEQESEDENENEDDNDGTPPALPATASANAQAVLGVNSNSDNYVPQVREFNVTVKTWAFEPNMISVRKGDRVVIHLKNVTAEDVHGFALKAYGIKVTILPGETKTVEFIAGQEGTFVFSCSVYCGDGHGDMKGKLVVTR